MSSPSSLAGAAVSVSKGVHRSVQKSLQDGQRVQPGQTWNHKAGRQKVSCKNNSKHKHVFWYYWDWLQTLLTTQLVCHYVCTTNKYTLIQYVLYKDSHRCKYEQTIAQRCHCHAALLVKIGLCNHDKTWHTVLWYAGLFVFLTFTLQNHTLMKTKVHCKAYNKYTPLFRIPNDSFFFFKHLVEF